MPGCLKCEPLEQLSDKQPQSHMKCEEAEGQQPPHTKSKQQSHCGQLRDCRAGQSSGRTGFCINLILQLGTGPQAHKCLIARSGKHMQSAKLVISDADFQCPKSDLLTSFHSELLAYFRMFTPRSPKLEYRLSVKNWSSTCQSDRASRPNRRHQCHMKYQSLSVLPFTRRGDIS